MNRREFLKTAGKGIAALAAVAVLPEVPALLETDSEIDDSLTLANAEEYTQTGEATKIFDDELGGYLVPEPYAHQLIESVKSWKCKPKHVNCKCNIVAGEFSKDFTFSIKQSTSGTEWMPLENYEKIVTFATL